MWIIILVSILLLAQGSQLILNQKNGLKPERFPSRQGWLWTSLLNLNLNQTVASIVIFSAHFNKFSHTSTEKKPKKQNNPKLDSLSQITTASSVQQNATYWIRARGRNRLPPGRDGLSGMRLKNSSVYFYLYCKQTENIYLKRSQLGICLRHWKKSINYSTIILRLFMGTVKKIWI